MHLGIYKAKRALRAPIIWWGRYRWRNEVPEVRWRLEHTLYRRRARLVWAASAIDPMHLYRADIDQTSVILDLGAYRGEVARDLHRLYKCRVYGFEPVPDYYEEAQRRFVKNPAVEIFPYGLGGADATLEIEIRGPGSTVHGPKGAGKEAVEIQIRDIVTTLDELGLDHVDFVKLNIEGAEYDVLERLAEAGWIDRIRYLLIQFHEGYPKAEVRRWRIRRRLRQTHEEIWNYPWVYELWCSKDQPHPRPPKLTREETELVKERIRAGIPVDPLDPLGKLKAQEDRAEA